MKRVKILQVLNEESGLDHGEWVERLGHALLWGFSVTDALATLHNHGDVSGVIIDGFPVDEAELIALEIKMEFDGVYIAILNETIKHKGHNEYAELIPQAFIPFKEALMHRFSEAM